MSEKIVLTAFGSLWSAMDLLGRWGLDAAERAELCPQVLDEAACRREVGRFLGEDRVEGVGAPRRDLSGREQEPEQALRPVEPAPEVVVLAEGAVEEGGEVAEAGAVELRRPRPRLEQVALEGADAEDLHLVALANVAQRLHREEEHVPEGEPEVADEEVRARASPPLRRQRAERARERRREVAELGGEEALEVRPHRVEVGAARSEEARRIELALGDRRRDRLLVEDLPEARDQGGLQSGAARQPLDPLDVVVEELLRRHELLAGGDVALADVAIPPAQGGDQEPELAQRVVDVEPAQEAELLVCRPRRAGEEAAAAGPLAHHGADEERVVRIVRGVEDLVHEL